MLQVSVGFITASRQRYERAGVDGLRSNYWGTRGYLTLQQKQELFTWLGQQDAWTLEEVMEHIEDEYDVVYQSQRELLCSTGASRLQLEEGAACASRQE